MIPTKKKHDTLLLVSKQLFNASHQFHIRRTQLEDSTSRHVLHFVGTVHGQKLVFSTAHLASRFFEEGATALKKKQLQKIRANQRYLIQKYFDPGTPETEVLSMLIGDTNLTGGEGCLELENAAVENSGYTDAWKRWQLSKFKPPVSLTTFDLPFLFYEHPSKGRNKPKEGERSNAIIQQIW